MHPVGCLPCGRNSNGSFTDFTAFIPLSNPFCLCTRWHKWRFCNCCDMGQNDTISKIELNPSFILSSDETNSKNDIQLFHQLFDELRVNRDCH